MSDKINFDASAIQAAVVERLADGIRCEFDAYDILVGIIEDKINAEFANGVQPLIIKMISDAAESAFDREYRRVTSFGNAEGEPTTIRKEVERLVANFWTQTVDREGRPTDSKYNTTTRAQWLMADMSGKGFSEQIKPLAVEMAGQMKDGLRAQLLGATSKILDELFRVQSLQDQAAKKGLR